MSSPPSTPTVAQPVRERILAATLKLAAEEGVAAVTNRRIAAQADVSLGSLTYHFASQEDLLRESLLLYVDAETARREAISRELVRERPSLERVAEAVEEAVAANVPEQIAELDLHLHAARDPELRDASQRCFQAHEQIAATALATLGVPEAQRHAAKVVALMTGLAVRRLAGGGRDAQGTSEALLALVRGLAGVPASD